MIEELTSFVVCSANQETNLDCRGFAASFFSTVSKVEEVSLSKLRAYVRNFF